MISGRVDLDWVEKVIHQRCLGLIERFHLSASIRAEMTIRQIAAAMNRSPSTISRKLRRNTVSTRTYLSYTAYRLSAQRRKRQRQPKLVANAELHAYVLAKLKLKWSPQQISYRLAKDFPNCT